jgi:ribosomal protein S12 methylthiotransferase accessory factor
MVTPRSPHALLDARTGLLRRLEAQPMPDHLPRALRLVSAFCSDTTRFCSSPSDLVASGCTWWDTDGAQAAAIGEAVERYCGNLIPAGLRQASYAELRAEGTAAIDPQTLVLYSEDQYRAPGFPFVPFTHDLRVRWAPGVDMVSGQATLVPASLVYVTYFRTPPTAGEPRTNFIMYAGIAAGSGRDDAERSALEELVERDAVMLAWLRGGVLQRVALPPDLATLFRGPDGVLDATVLTFPSESGLPVAGVLLRDRDRDVMALGTACRSDFRAAVLKAYAEAAQQHILLQELDDQSSGLMREVREDPAHLLKPWRADRSYGQAYRPDWHDVRDLMCQLQLYLDPAMRRDVDSRFEGAAVRWDEAPSPVERSRTAHLAALARSGIHPVSVDLTTPDVRSAGLHVVRVVAPGLHPNAPAAFPYLGGTRLYHWPDRITPDHVDLTPLPYA